MLTRLSVTALFCLAPALAAQSPAELRAERAMQVSERAGERKERDSLIALIARRAARIHIIDSLLRLPAPPPPPVDTTKPPVPPDTTKPPVPPTQGVLAFGSDWRGAVGTSNAAVSDGGKWGLSIDGGGPANRREVVPAAGLGFPAGMANVLRVSYRNNNSDYWNVDVEGKWNLPPVGSSLYFRIYFRYDVSGSGGGALHTIQTGPPGNCPYTTEIQFSRVGTDGINVYVSTLGGSGGGGGNAHDWRVLGLKRGVTYRLEERYERVSDAGYKLDIRVYDSANALVKQASDFVDQYQGATLAAYKGVITGNNCLRNKMIGNPGDGGRGSTDVAHQSIYYGGFAVSLADWVGPYVPE